MHRREWLRAGLGAAGSALVAGRAWGQDPKDDSDPAALIAKIGPTMGKIPIETVRVAAGLDVLTGPGGNVAVLQGPDGLFVVDSGIPDRGKDILDAARKAGGKPVTLLVDTHWHFDHAGGNEAFAKAGATIAATAATRKRLSTDQYTEVFKMTTPAAPAAALPVWSFDEAEVHVGGETVRMTAVPPAHTDGDLVVHFTAADVVHAGDLFSNGFYPNIDASSGGWIGGMVAAADRLLKLAGPKTKIIPGHGPLADRDDLAAFRKMLATVHDRLAPMADAGKTVEEAIAAKPTKDFDPVWGKGFFNGGMFTRIAYGGVLNHRKAAGRA